MTTLVGLIETVDLLDVAGDRSYARGVSYAEDGRVSLGDVSAQHVEARVRGEESYRVELSVDRGRLGWSCSCPIGVSGECCKHVVAVAVVLAGDVESGAAPASRAPDDLRAYLATLDAGQLAAIVLEQAERDPRLHDRLTARAAARLGLDLDDAAWRKRVDAAFRRRGRFVDYRSAPEWARSVYELLDTLGDLVDAGHGASVVTLAERCHKKCEAATGYVDDSDGWITDIFHRVGDLHHRACVASGPPAVPLARRLAKLELTAELDTFHRAATRYADVLGPEGLAAYRRVVEPKWAALGPGGPQWSGEEYRIREAMVGVALASGDPDELIRVKQRDLRLPGDYEEVARVLCSAGRADEALEWARAGLARFADRPRQVRDLEDLVAELLRDKGGDDDAVEVFAVAFATQPSLAGYQRLLGEAGRVGDDERDRRRTWALTRVRGDARLMSLLVEVLLDDGQVDEAWTVAVVHGCEQRLWLALAVAREKSDPLDVIPVYVVELQRQIDSRSKSGYRAAVKTLAHIEALAVAGGAPERFDEILATTRAEHGQKRSLVELLAGRGW